jgi:hypothetical protein
VPAEMAEDGCGFVDGAGYEDGVGAVGGVEVAAVEYADCGVGGGGKVVEEADEALFVVDLRILAMIGDCWSLEIVPSVLADSPL